MPQQSQTFIFSTNQISWFSGRSQRGFKIESQIANQTLGGMHLCLPLVMESNKITSTLGPCNSTPTYKGFKTSSNFWNFLATIAKISKAQEKEQSLEYKQFVMWVFMCEL